MNSPTRRVPGTVASRSGTGAAGEALLTSLLARPWGQWSLSAYETGRVVALAPRLSGDDARLRWLLEQQRPDGGWGGPGGYALVPTLSVVEALLRRLRESPAQLHPMAASAERGVHLLLGLPAGADAAGLPDMPACDHLAFALLGQVNDHLKTLGRRERLPVPGGLDKGVVGAAQRMLAAGVALPRKLEHALEMAGPAAAGARGITPDPVTGAVGCSPAATAAWLAGGADRSAGHYLETLIAQTGGPVPVAAPIDTFERAWVIGNLLRADVPVAVPAALSDALAAALDEAGAAAGAGLPPDADTTSGVIHALGLLGRPQSVDSLRHYETEGRFCTWPGEQGFSVTTNAHVLEALGQRLTLEPGHPWCARSVHMLVGFLIDHQQPQGFWTDRWHASPLYATACCTGALAVHGGERARPAIRRARAWVSGTRRPDGSWGRWGATAEETAYAVQILSSGDGSPGPEAAAGLEALTGPLATAERPALWHDKDLYLPEAVVDSVVLAALHAGRPSRGAVVDGPSRPGPR